MSKYDTLESEFDIQITNHSKWLAYSDAHFHNGYELYFLFFGRTKYIIEDIVEEINPGDIVWIPPYIDHKTRPTDMEQHKRMLFYISIDFYNQTVGNYPELVEFFRHYRIIHTQPNEAKLFRRYANLLLEELFAEASDMRGIISKGLFLSLLAQLKRMHDRNGSANASPGKAPSSKHTMNLLMSYINTNYSKAISLDSLAEQINMNPAYISSLFKKTFGFSFKEYLVKLRIEKATKLLKQTNMTVEKIALECGFSSSNHFCKTFKRLVGTPPMMFRAIDRE